MTSHSLSAQEDFEMTSVRRALQETSGKSLRIKLKFQDENKADAARDDIEAKVQVAASSAGVDKPTIDLQPKVEAPPSNATESTSDDPWVPTPCESVPTFRDHNSAKTGEVEIMTV